MRKPASAVNAERPRHVFLCEGSAGSAGPFRRLVGLGVDLVEPVCAPTIPASYGDFFALADCKLIYVAGKFPGFSLIAGLVGDSPVRMAASTASLLQRYGTRIESLASVAAVEDTA